MLLHSIYKTEQIKLNVVLLAVLLSMIAYLPMSFIIYLTEAGNNAVQEKYK